MCERRDATVRSHTRLILKCTLPEHEGNHYDAVMFAEWEPISVDMNDLEFRNWEQRIIGGLNTGANAFTAFGLGFGYGFG